MTSRSAAQTFLMQVRETLRQAWPVLISAWASMAFGVMDTAMAGHASAADLQAMSLAVSIYITIFVGLMGVIHALIPIIGQHYGAQRLLEVGRAWGQGVWLSMGLSALGAIAMLFPDAWLSLSGDVDPAVRNGVTWYLRALILALPAALAFRAIYALGTAVSRPKVVMTINLAAIVVKGVFNWVFIFGKLGAPALGAAGAGLSTAITSWFSLAAGLWIMRHDGFFRQFQPRLDRPRWADLKELLRLGIPMGGSYLVEVVAFTFMALLIAREGMYATGGHQITANLVALCYMLPMSIGIASASLTAQAIGARDMARARQTGLAGLSIALAGALLTIALIMGFKPAILAAYTDNLEVAAMAALLLQILPYFHLCDAMQCVNAYLLRAYKVAVIPLLMQIIALLGLGLAGGWWLGFGPGAGSLAPVLQIIMPGAPSGAASMWLMAAIGLGLSALLQHIWYWHVVRQHSAHSA
ncbi:MAG TPA: MATE family efflux transporter [Pusillimonas sp.]|jgi:MATE family multidrug resistance protein|uniref:MATE family efflux transporter n=1 Tax=unclassified Pusillimonas TaxID=2640016 RepID=UPI00261852F5|nr:MULTISPECIES: MATE family efflux transporter [unclassified Pusillimonas]HLU20682.1 MATE family efflux transporter [Pusillimonas sp.]